MTDAAGAAFWFNGQDQIGPNPAIFANAAYGKSLTTTAPRASSPGSRLEKPKPMTVKFTKAGSYTVYCDIHPGMEATVKVVKKGAAVPTAKQDAAAVKKQADAVVKAAKDLETTSPGGEHRRPRHRGQGRRGVLRDGPGEADRRAGHDGEVPDDQGHLRGPHGVVRPRQPSPIPRPTSARSPSPSSRPAIDPRGVYPSDVTPVPRLNAALHGNGFWNSGALDVDKNRRCRSPSSVKFDTRRHLQVLLPDPPVHGRYRHRPVRRLTHGFDHRGGEPARRPVGVRGHPRVLGGGGAGDLQHRPQRPRRDHGDGVHAGRHGVRHDGVPPLHAQLAQADRQRRRRRARATPT